MIADSPKTLVFTNRNSSAMVADELQSNENQTLELVVAIVVQFKKSLYLYAVVFMWLLGGV